MEVTSDPFSWLACALFLIGAPLLVGLVNKLKARLSGRFGPPLVQPYYELFRLARKETVYSTRAGFISRVAPVIVWCTVAFAALLLPLGRPPVISFSGDIILFAYLLAFGRFFQILAALDVASSFEGMGASREARFAVFAEPIFFFTMGSLALVTKRYSFETILAGISWSSPLFVVFIFVGLLSLFFLMMAECSRMPVDDPNTHLELTMIHEVMILDASGFDLMLYQYAAALKLLLYSTLAALLLNPFGVLGPALGLLVFSATLLVLAAGLAFIETLIARFRLVLVPQFLLFATAIGVLNILIFTFSRQP
ncbi:MAG: NADH-quinone oxidoreductase subunit H [Methylacidiphilales bacterium]|nr:NADH-quinone oxidoreductase subunit H [Candidatus Methylacidiphilales bacterium]